MRFLSKSDLGGGGLQPAEPRLCGRLKPTATRIGHRISFSTRGEVAGDRTAHAGIADAARDSPGIEVFHHRLRVLAGRPNRVPELRERDAAVRLDKGERLFHHRVVCLAAEDDALRDAHDTSFVGEDGQRLRPNAEGRRVRRGVRLPREGGEQAIGGGALRGRSVTA